MRSRQHLCVFLVVGAASGCGLTLDLDPALRGSDAGTSVEPRDAAIADASFDAAAPPVDAAPPFDAATPLPDAGFDCPHDVVWPADGTCGPVLFSDSFESPVIGSDWVLLRTEFSLEGGGLESLPEPRNLVGGGTFPYGHFANGRGGIASLNVDGHLGVWRNYRVDWKARVASTDEAFAGGFPPGFVTSGCDATIAFYFRAQLLTESWNDAPGATYYSFGISSGAGDGCADLLGNWSFAAVNDFWMPGTGYDGLNYVGFADLLLGSSRIAGATYPPYAGFTGSVDRVHDYAVEVRGPTMDAWVDGSHIGTFTDSAHAMIAPDSTRRPHAVIASGGVAFTAGYDEMFWIDDVVVTELP